MKTTEREFGYIDEQMFRLGFMEVENKKGIYWIKYFGKDIHFDLTACGNTIDSIMFHIFNVALEQGQLSKLKEVQNVLGIK